MCPTRSYDISGRKLRVEYKKVLQAGEKERIEREKAIKRMRSMQFDKNVQQPGLPPQLQQQVQQLQQQPQQMQQQQQQQQQTYGIASSRQGGWPDASNNGGNIYGNQLPNGMNAAQDFRQSSSTGSSNNVFPGSLRNSSGMTSSPASPLPPQTPTYQNQQRSMDMIMQSFQDQNQKDLSPSSTAYSTSIGLSASGHDADIERGPSPSVTSTSNHGSVVNFNSQQHMQLPTSGDPSGASSGSSASMPTSVDFNDPVALDIYSRVLVFKEDRMRDELAFSRSLSARERRIIHLVAQKLGLWHYSIGEGEDRYAVVTRTENDRAKSLKVRSKRSFNAMRAS